MDGNPTDFLSAQEVRISKVVKPRLKHSAQLQNENRDCLNKLKKETEMKNAVADDSGVITDVMNKRDETQKKKQRKQLREGIKKKKKVSLNLSLCDSLILRF